MSTKSQRRTEMLADKYSKGEITRNELQELLAAKGFDKAEIEKRLFMEFESDNRFKLV